MCIEQDETIGWLNTRWSDKIFRLLYSLKWEETDDCSLFSKTVDSYSAGPVLK